MARHDENEYDWVPNPLDWNREHKKHSRFVENCPMCFDRKLLESWRPVITNLANAFREMYEWETYTFKPLVRKPPIAWINSGDEEK